MALFDLKKPCKDCPFRKDGTMLKSLERERMSQIVKNVFFEDGFFPCHKTVKYTDDTGEELSENGVLPLQPQNKFCAGALIALECANATRDNLNTRLALMFKMYDPKELDDKASVIDAREYLNYKK